MSNAAIIRLRRYFLLAIATSFFGKTTSFFGKTTLNLLLKDLIINHLLKEIDD